MIGPAGAGKSALLDELSRRVRRDGGAVFHASARPGALSYESFARAADQALHEPEQPTLLILENLHWCDPPTERLCAGLLESVPLVLRGLLVLSSRPDITLPDGAERITIGPLDHAAVRQLLQTEPVVERVLAATGGDPARLVALLVGQATAVAPPTHRQRPLAGQLLEALAVYNEPAGPDHLVALAGGAGDVAPIVADLVESGILEKTITDGVMRVGFAQGPAQEEVYAGILPEQRRRLHQAVADLVSDREHGLEARAHHLLLAEVGDAAALAALRAGQSLTAAGEPERAVDLYSRALAQVQDERLRADLDERMTALLEAQGEFARALPHAERLAARDPGDRFAKRRLVRVLLGCGQLAGARALLDDLDGPCAERAEVLLRAGDLEGSAREAAAAIENSDDPIAARNVVGKTRMLAGDLAGAGRLFSQNVAEARAGGRAREEAGSLLNLGMVALEQCRHDEACRHYQEALTAANRAKDRLVQALCMQHLAVMAYRQRRYADALRGLQGAVDALKRLNHRGHLSWVALDLGFCYLDLGEHDRAQELCEFAARLAGAAGAPAATACDLDVLRGRLAAADGRTEQARELLHSALSNAGAGADRAAEAALALADLEISTGNPAAVTAHLEAAWPPPPRLRGAFLLRRGDAALAMGRFVLARSLLYRSVAVLQRIHDPEETARAAHSLARTCEAMGRGTEARRAREQARSAEEVLARQRPASTRDREAGPTALKPAIQAPATLRGHHHRAGTYPNMIGRHPRMIEMFALLDKVSRSDATVLIRGESGTGKELVAEAIHAQSARSRRRLVTVNCGALVDTLLASELFGHEKGAFTGAHERRRGLFEAADGGTLFLDEIADVSPRAQATLLRVLQEHEFERVGGTRALRVDVRVVAATHSDLERCVSEGTFREDLYYRLKGIEIEVPALHERREDIPLLCEHFLSKIAQERGGEPLAIAPDALDLLTRYRWPGNVRELENVLRSVSLFAEGATIRADGLSDYKEIARPSTPRSHQASPMAGDAVAALFEEGLPLSELKRKVEIECISRALRESGGNITQAARRLGMKRPRLSQLLKEHGIVVRKAC